MAGPPSAASPAAAGAEGTPQERSIAFQRIDVGKYQNFIGNWDDRQQPVLLALIQSPAHYDALFHPAALMGGNRAFAPETGLYRNEQILVVARVLAAPKDMDAVFEVERISYSGPALTVRYRFKDPDSKASFTVKDYLAVRIPRRNYQKAVFVENGKPIGELNLAAGQWSVPAVSTEPPPGKGGS